MTSLSAQLDEINRSHGPLLTYSWTRLFESPDARSGFISYLCEMYHYAKFSCPLMELTRARLDDRNAEVARYLTHHIEEEAGHDDWVLADLQRLGLSPDEVHRSRPSRETISLIGSQFYMINELNPIGYLGYIYALESNPPTEESIRKLSARLDLPLAALSALTEHAEADPGHIRDLNQMMDDAVASQEDQEWIRYNLQMTLENLSDLVLSVAVRS